jgi:bla regulator protein blaR1
MSALGDHLWQSTLFALAAGLLTLVLHGNRASDRYRLWLAASLKFLLPFSVLAGVGRHLAWTPMTAGAKSGFYIAINEIGHPFTEPVTTGVLLPAGLAVAWFCGFAAVIAAWYLRWRGVSAVARAAVPLVQGREVESLRRIERIAGMRRPITMLSSAHSLEPGIFGILFPALLWPRGISAHLEDGHLMAILAHEVWHVRRRDNLTAALHMVVEAVFWFHPLVWWLGARLVDERERACDEKVLEWGSERRVYAESILKTCQFCAGIRLACASAMTGTSGAAGADLEKRIVSVMTQRAIRKLNFSRKLLLGTAGLVTIAVPTLLGSLNAAAARTLPGAAALAANRSARSNQSAPADSTMLQLLRAASVPGAACPNAAPAADPFSSAKIQPRTNL